MCRAGVSFGVVLLAASGCTTIDTPGPGPLDASPFDALPMPEAGSVMDAGSDAGAPPPDASFCPDADVGCETSEAGS
jgi:hypothetical protein